MTKTMVNYSKKILFTMCLVPCLFVSVSVADDKPCSVNGTPESAPKICGIASQGGMLYGNTNGQDVYANDVKISNKGIFVLGLDRDAPDTLKLRFCAPESKDFCQTYSYVIKQRKYLEQKVSVPDKFVEYPKEVEERIGRENKQIVSVRDKALSDTMQYFKELVLPDNLSKYRVSGVYGSRRVFNGQPKAPHKGLDFAAPAGTPVYPIAVGQVVLAADHYMNGNIVMVSHGYGIVSAYLHLSEIDVNIGDKVDTKTILGKVGSTGRSSGAHLHLGLYWGQTAIDPALFILKEATKNVKK